MHFGEVLIANLENCAHIILQDVFIQALKQEPELVGQITDRHKIFSRQANGINIGYRNVVEVFSGQ